MGVLEKVDCLFNFYVTGLRGPYLEKIARKPEILDTELDKVFR